MEGCSHYFEIWTKKDDNGQSLLDYVQAKLVDNARLESERNLSPSMLIVDSKTIQNADTAEEKGYDGGKKKTGVKIHIAVDINGLPYAIYVTTANISDMKGGIEMFSQPSYHSFSFLETVLGDGTYAGKNFADAIYELTGAKVEIARRSELHTFAVIPKRWIVERTFAWLDKCRRLWKNCERKIGNTLNMIKFAFVSLLLRRYE